jgi:hypothetical protein
VRRNSATAAGAVRRKSSLKKRSMATSAMPASPFSRTVAMRCSQASRGGSMRRRGGKHQMVEPRTGVNGEPLTREAAHRHAAKRKPFEPQMIGERQHVEAEPLDRIGSGRRLAGAMAALVVTDDPEGMARASTCGCHIM